MPGEVKDPRQG